MMITGNSGKALASAKTPRPLNIGIRRSVMTTSNRFSESASFFTTATGSDTPVTCIPSPASTLLIAPEHSRIVIYYQNRFIVQLVHNLSRNWPTPYGKSPRWGGFAREPIQPNRADYRRIPEIRQLREVNRH